MELSNYEITRNKARGQFLEYEQEPIIDKFNLEHDQKYIYITFVGRPYRIERSTGIVTWSEDGFITCVEANFEESLTIYDVLCYSKPGCHLSGTFCSLKTMRNTAQFSNGGIDMSQKIADAFTGRVPELKRACEMIGSANGMKGDAAFTIPAFSFLPVVLQYWEADDEFPACLKFMFDDNILDFMHYETVYYMMGHMLNRICELSSTRLNA